jgi:hypothetical protein
MRIEYQNREFDLEFRYHANGTGLSAYEVMPDLEFVKLSDYLYPLQTEFEILCSFAAEQFGESVHGESLAELMGVEMITSDDAKCPLCERYYYYGDMVAGESLPEAEQDLLEISKWDFVCHECYESKSINN